MSETSRPSRHLTLADVRSDQRRRAAATGPGRDGLSAPDRLVFGVILLLIPTLWIAMAVRLEVVCWAILGLISCLSAVLATGVLRHRE